MMDKAVKILILNNEIEAALIDGLLTERNIPHMIRSFHDSVYTCTVSGRCSQAGASFLLPKNTAKK